MSNITKPIMLDETGKLIVQELKEVANSNKAYELLLKTKADKVDVSTPYNYKGVATYDTLPTSDNVVNDTYYCEDKKCKYTWNGEGWYQSSMSEVDYTEELAQLGEKSNQLSEQIDSLSGKDKEIVFENEFTQGNVNTVNDYIDDSTSYAIKNLINKKIYGRLKIKLNEGFRAYLSYNNGNDIINIPTTQGSEYHLNGTVSQYIDGRQVYIVLTKEDFSDITVDELKNVGLSILLLSNNSLYCEKTPKLSNFAHSRKGAKLLPVIDVWNTVFEHTGEGILETMFFAGDFNVKRTKLRITVDDTIVSIEGMLYELIGLLSDRNNNVLFGNELFGKTGDKNGIYLNYKVPFYKNIKIEIMNDSDTSNPYVWFNARVSKWHRITVAGVDIPYGAYFYCKSKYALNVESGEEIELYSSLNNGVITNINMSAKGATSSWYQEGMLRAYVGESTVPQLISSGLEDYFLGTYYFSTGTYHLSIAGCSYIDTQTDHLFAGYRLHTHDLLSHEKGGYRLTVRNSDINIEDLTFIQNPTLANYRWYVGRYEW